MLTQLDQERIKVLVADDDEQVLECYLEVFRDDAATKNMLVLDALASELFDPETEIEDQPKFNIVSCSQGQDAIDAVTAAKDAGEPFDAVILDVRMPPGIDGVEAGSQIRKLDSDVKIVFVTGFSDMPFEDLQRRVPPPKNLHYFNKPLSFSALAKDVVSMVRGN